MALYPIDAAHAAQIQAGTAGRRKGHDFEFHLAKQINALRYPQTASVPPQHVFRGDAASALVRFAAANLGWSHCKKAEAIALGALATAEEGREWLEVNGVKVRACKSDVLLTLVGPDQETVTLGVSVKQCNNPTPTNAQLYFTTARAFCDLLRRNQINVSDHAETALHQFCGDPDYRPVDDPRQMRGRLTDPRRLFWEETHPEGRAEFEELFRLYQDNITRLLLQKAYLVDPFTPEALLHKTRKIPGGPQEFALYTIDELIRLSRQYQGFAKKLYSVKKGHHKDPPGIMHEAPRFGIVQMQRGGQKQHPTQLQFNLEAGYFYKI